MHPNLAAGDSQPGALGRASSVPLVQQDQIRGQFQCQRDGLGLAGVKIGREQSRDMVLSNHPMASSVRSRPAIASSGMRRPWSTES